MRHAALALVIATACSANAHAQSFVNWENPHVHPLDLTPDGNILLAVNTPDNRLEVFDVSTGLPTLVASIPVGLDPVSVRAASNDRAWVVNHISDSVSVVDLAAGNVIATLATDDEPCDVVFAGAPRRAFVSCSQANTILVFDEADLSVAPIRLDIDAEDPRALAVSPDGARVYAAIFESGNGSTILGGGSTINNGFPPNVVSDPAGPYGGTNPPPNQGAVIFPAPNPNNPPPPPVGLIVKKDAAGNWFDDNAHDWTNLVSGSDADLSGRPVGWDLPDRDVAIIDVGTLNITYATRLMNICMALAVNPATGHLAVIGTDGINEVRFEPVVRGIFIRVLVALLDPDAPAAASVVDLNPHLTYAAPTIPQPGRNVSLGDPRGIVFNGTGTTAWVSGMGSNNVIVVDAAGARTGAPQTIAVGEGPTGLALREAAGRLYVLNKFDASISVVDTAARTEIARVPFYDPSPAAIRLGRKHLYDTHKTSGLGQASCASCHVDARIDRLAWDLGDPPGPVKVFNQNCGNGIDFGCQNWHPMKGPMLTQTLQDIIGKEPHHWRGDREGIEAFNGAFIGLLGDDVTLTPVEMQQFEDFLGTIHFPPNPFRNFDNTLPDALPLTGHFTTGRFSAAGLPLPDGDAINGLELYRTAGLDAGLQCVSCHTLPTGIGADYRLGPGFQFVPIPPGPNGERHHAVVSVDGSTNLAIKIPQLRNLYDRVGFELTQTANNAGFGFLHDGSVDSLARFVTEPLFSPESDQEVADLVAFLLAFAGSDLPMGDVNDALELPGPLGQDTHAAVGAQITYDESNRAAPAAIATLDDMIALADALAVGLVAKGVQAGLPRGYEYVGAGLMQTDRASETILASALRLAAAAGNEVTFTVVPYGSQRRIGIDRDFDGHYDRDELDACSDPADPASTPQPDGCPCGPPGDLDCDGRVNLTDFSTFSVCYTGGPGPFPPPDACAPEAYSRADTDGDGDVDLSDFATLAANFTG